MNHWINSTIYFHDTLCGFHSVQGTGTASLESKLLQHLTEMREDIIYEIFLGLRKAYGALDGERCLDLLVGYSVGPRALCLLVT